MAKFYVEVEEVLTKIVEVEAETAEEAKDKVEDAYDEGEVVLDSECFYDKQFSVVEDYEGDADQKI
jgi:hypothetical protein